MDLSSPTELPLLQQLQADPTNICVLLGTVNYRRVQSKAGNRPLIYEYLCQAEITMG